MKKDQLEIACFNLQSAIIAQENGADRVELCANMNEGGTTPDFEITEAARKELKIKLNVMIRPRGGDFVYSDAEFEQMKTEIQQFKKLNLDGFVFGILDKDGNVNKEQNSELVALAHPVPCTFHRAFDVVANVYESLESIIECGFKTILTSGQEKNVVEGIDVLAELVRKADNRITIMPGGGLRSSNIGLLKEKTNAIFYHSSAIVDPGETANGEEVKAMKSRL
ncbi:copper homeostasis protein CutC [Flavobacterium granuli]|uniref:PF03932 family protein CutC n=1 Tax=Flavobacterium granuli TaxID=280093 RepID=A0A1M5M1K8_9FLAO|nr:copper homeostasis protein CutC [Flavobacterium granuli]PRZ24182.1 copper homeostasis protein [Flavobacterium granuli]SHG71145.1 copper homeostasis protein [Flavobacterium granuli]